MGPENVNKPESLCSLSPKYCILFEKVETDRYKQDDCDLHPVKIAVSFFLFFALLIN